MQFKARIYENVEQATLACERLMAIESRLPKQDRLIVRVILNSDDHVVVLGWKKKDKHIARVKDGHWVGGETYVLSPEDERRLVSMFKKLDETDPGDHKIDKIWSPSEPGIIDDEGNIA
jgi:hypothetical protein